jgi:hypothetical protein
LNDIAQKRWNVYAKEPFGGPLQVLQYLGRYTHKVAITAHRIKKIDAEKSTITFAYKDYHARGTKDEQKEMTITIDEFIRRYEQHICYQLAFSLSLLVCPLFAVSLCVGLVALLHFFVWLLRWQKMQMCYQMRWLNYVVKIVPLR